MQIIGTRFLLERNLYRAHIHSINIHLELNLDRDPHLFE